MRRSLPLIVALLLAPSASAARVDAPKLTVSGTTVAWDTGTGSPGEVRVVGEAGQENVFATGAPAGKQDAPWLEGGGRYVFRLYCPWTGGPPIATLQVVHSPSGPVAMERSTGTCPPPSSPAGVNATLRVLPLALAVLLAVGLGWYVRTRGERAT